MNWTYQLLIHAASAAAADDDDNLLDQNINDIKK
jgi:hypothetical protein